PLQPSVPPDSVVNVRGPPGHVGELRIADDRPALTIPLNLRLGPQDTQPSPIGSGQTHPVNRLSEKAALVVLVSSPRLNHRPGGNTLGGRAEDGVTVLVRRLLLGKHQDVCVPAIKQTHRPPTTPPDGQGCARRRAD